MHSVGQCLSSVLSFNFILPAMDACVAMMMSIFHTSYSNYPWRQRLFDAAMCGMISWNVYDALVLLQLNTAWTNIICVAIGILGAEYVNALFKVLLNRRLNRYSDKK
ncbi:phage holin family protein [Serratia proteamaculans]|uniref:Phage holin, lambda family n=1 Tax=Serratia proteamaculans TaxID=28151 RepID=A0A5Q2V958_SERPR|nr:phage holin, lambda family [Serratia proteamaculans]